MELYIENNFLDDFYADYNDEPVKEIVKNIIIGYGRKRVFINFDINDFEKLENENEFFALISNISSPNPIDSIEEHLFLNSDFDQTIIFMNNTQEWFSDAERKGALCFSFDNYEERIKEIIDKLHFKIDLSENFEDWSFSSNYNYLKFNKISILDGYILTNKKNQEMNKNIIPLLKGILYLKNNENHKIEFLSKDIIDIDKFKKENRNLGYFASIEKIEKLKKKKASKLYTKLNSYFANYNVRFSIIMNNLIRNAFDFHDRIILTNFSLLECGKGFNLIPYRKSNSRLISETIFDKDCYKRLNNLRQMQEEYIEDLKKLENNKFKMYPES